MKHFLKKLWYRINYVMFGKDLHLAYYHDKTKYPTIVEPTIDEQSSYKHGQKFIKEFHPNEPGVMLVQCDKKIDGFYVYDVHDFITNMTMIRICCNEYGCYEVKS